MSGGGSPEDDTSDAPSSASGSAAESGAGVEQVPSTTGARAGSDAIHGTSAAEGAREAPHRDTLNTMPSQPQYNAPDPILLTLFANRDSPHAGGSYVPLLVVALHAIRH
ncbi:hypothetical protein C2E23DRAFT_839780 [Lenzites betulinus]|nr:hypothetical protein C2E23DRAFT_839780 [Lenzites betulinus]